jgi:hypothetical protein
MSTLDFNTSNSLHVETTHHCGGGPWELSAHIGERDMHGAWYLLNQTNVMTLGAQVKAHPLKYVEIGQLSERDPHFDQLGGRDILWTLFENMSTVWFFIGPPIPLNIRTREPDNITMLHGTCSHLILQFMNNLLYLALDMSYPANNPNPIARDPPVLCPNPPCHMFWLRHLYLDLAAVTLLQEHFPANFPFLTHLSLTTAYKHVITARSLQVCFLRTIRSPEIIITAPALTHLMVSRVTAGKFAQNQILKGAVPELQELVLYCLPNTFNCSTACIGTMSCGIGPLGLEWGSLPHPEKGIIPTWGINWVAHFSGCSHDDHNDNGGGGGDDDNDLPLPLHA